MFLNIQIYSIILNTDDEQFTLTTKKKSLQITFNVAFQHKYGYIRDKIACNQKPNRIHAMTMMMMMMTIMMMT